jgi:hypothetical protein
LTSISTLANDPRAPDAEGTEEMELEVAIERRVVRVTDILKRHCAKLVLHLLQMGRDGSIALGKLQDFSLTLFDHQGHFTQSFFRLFQLGL